MRAWAVCMVMLSLGCALGEGEPQTWERSGAVRATGPLRRIGWNEAPPCSCVMWQEGFGEEDWFAAVQCPEARPNAFGDNRNHFLNFELRWLPLPGLRGPATLTWVSGDLVETQSGQGQALVRVYPGEPVPGVPTQAIVPVVIEAAATMLPEDCEAGDCSRRPSGRIEEAWLSCVQNF